MFLLFGRRYPWIALAGGALFLVIGIVTGSIGSLVIGAIGLLVGGYRAFAAWRRGGSVLGGVNGAGGASGMPR
jgi:hypothetical protein